jgi:nucleotide-binding universal stress UspA family protein
METTDASSMFGKVLVAVDGSRQSSKTAAVAIDLAKRYGASVTVVHVREHGRYEGDDVDLGPAMPAQQLIDEVVERFRAQGIPAEGVLRRVSPGGTPEQIVLVAEESQAQLIIMGTRGMTEWKSLLLGGVANKVVTHAPCPVLLVR